MFNKILVAIDFSEVSKKVLDTAISLAKSANANLILLHVLSSEEEGSSMLSSYFPPCTDNCIHLDPQIMRRANEVYQREWKLFKPKGLESLRFYGKKAISAGVQTETSQIIGHPSSTICEFAQSCNADVIVIGRQGYSGFKQMFLGSVSNYVVHHAPCSILLVQTPILQQEKESIVVESIETKAFV